MNVDAILKQAEELTLEHRAELLHRLEQGMIDAGWMPDLELTDDLKAMLDVRIAHAGAGIPWEVVKSDSLKRARK